jgi:hypothetical protein
MRSAGDAKLHKRRRTDHLRSAIRGYQKPPWTPEGLMDKMGRLAVRLIAANTVLKEKTGIRVLGPSLESALNQLIYRDISVRKSIGPTPTTKPSTSPQPSASSAGSENKPENP